MRDRRGPFGRAQGAPQRAWNPRSPWPTILAGLFVVALVAGALALLLAGRDGAAPVAVVLDSPANGSQVVAGSQVLLQATARGDGITQLDLLVDGVVARSESSPEAGGSDSLAASTLWTFEAGTHIVSAEARTASGQTSRRAAASVFAVDSVSQATPATPGTSVAESPSPRPATATATSSPSRTLVPGGSVPSGTPQLFASPQPPTSRPATATAHTPSPTTAPTRTPQPTTATSQGSQPVPGLITGFEEFGTWTRGTQANGTFSASVEEVHAGAQAGSLAYRFPTGGNDFVVFLQTHALEGRPTEIAAWVYGDGQGHYLNVWISDADGETWQFSLGRVTHTGWQRMATRLQPGDPWPTGHIDGPSNGTIDYPISFQGLVLDDAPDSFTGEGRIFLDDVHYGERGGPAAPATQAPAPPTAVATLTASPSPTSSLAPTTPPATATPTATPVPATDTPTPVPATDTPSPAPVVQFWAEETTLSLKEATFLRWHLENVTAAFLDGQPVNTGDGRQRIRPEVTTTYSLRAVYPGGEQVAQVTVTVQGGG